MNRRYALCCFWLADEESCVSREQQVCGHLEVSHVVQQQLLRFVLFLCLDEHFGHVQPNFHHVQKVSAAVAV